MHDFNSSLYPEIVTLYIPCDEKLKSISSTLVKKALENNENLQDKLSSEVIKIIEKNSKQNSK